MNPLAIIAIILGIIAFTLNYSINNKSDPRGHHAKK